MSEHSNINSRVKLLNFAWLQREVIRKSKVAHVQPITSIGDEITYSIFFNYKHL